jgi:hypothetical protein
VDVAHDDAVLIDTHDLTFAVPFALHELIDVGDATLVEDLFFGAESDVVEIRREKLLCRGAPLGRCVVLHTSYTTRGVGRKNYFTRRSDLTGASRLQYQEGLTHTRGVL